VRQNVNLFGGLGYSSGGSFDAAAGLEFLYGRATKQSPRLHVGRRLRLRRGRSLRTSLPAAVGRTAPTAAPFAWSVRRGCGRDMIESNIGQVAAAPPQGVDSSEETRTNPPPNNPPPNNPPPNNPPPNNPPPSKPSVDCPPRLPATSR